ncbi:putative odorant-binding protein A10 isoform X1 [Anopheles merus]|uniref:putative odorant-binding protein A10 isoform X1 n=1 Tax=Anopheles merus TaxID=30066 RepID=UPI001BE3E09B|nr:putative odorant-binding protein A10 isoform X1 [Anopheles merus]XP_041761206.1 putative odorant-binding protein A10 isoform X1 [Anopheles merus]XP_041761207.1 putative odorant-binding protein A10 isoform X1 [Anopheles merus]XP_041761208.1 putative odorant-binding protein A10 isoform X1 [Anopheles merus]XP_041761209.1 putative odorant-binding protein A10 isoform X1 [Anopheles merus]
MQKTTGKQVSSRSAVSVCWLVGLGLVWLVAVALSGSTCAAEATTARTQVSDEALDKALSDKRYLMRQLKCALGEVACDPVGKRLKSLAPFVLRGACPQCTPAEMNQIKKTLAHLQRNFPSEWNKLVQTYAG